MIWPVSESRSDGYQVSATVQTGVSDPLPYAVRVAGRRGYKIRSAGVHRFTQTAVNLESMDTNRHAKLVQFVKHRAKDNLRAVIRYGADDYEVLYLRGNLRTSILEQALPVLHEKILKNRGLVTEDEYPRLGAIQATTEIHENGILLHLVEGEHAGTAVTLDREAGQNLTQFVEECTRILRASGTPPR